jgi:hypothetical protein
MSGVLHGWADPWDFRAGPFPQSRAFKVLQKVAPEMRGRARLQRYHDFMSRTPSRPAAAGASSDGRNDSPIPATLLKILSDDAAEERQHLLRDGIISIVMGGGTPLLLFLLFAGVLNFFRARWGFGLVGNVVPLLGWLMLVVYVIALLWAWKHVKPRVAVDERSSDPRFGRPKARANEADDEQYEEGLTPWTWDLALSGPSTISNLLSFGSRQTVQGFRSLFERSHLGLARIRLAASLLLRASQGDGVLSQSLPADAATHHALLFLWRNHYLRSDGVLSRTRLLPSDKGRRALEGTRA